MCAQPASASAVITAAPPTIPGTIHRKRIRLPPPLTLFRVCEQPWGCLLRHYKGKGYATGRWLHGLARSERTERGGGWYGRCLTSVVGVGWCGARVVTHSTTASLKGRAPLSRL